MQCNLKSWIGILRCQILSFDKHLLSEAIKLRINLPKEVHIRFRQSWMHLMIAFVCFTEVSNVPISSGELSPASASGDLSFQSPQKSFYREQVFWKVVNPSTWLITPYLWQKHDLLGPIFDKIICPFEMSLFCVNRGSFELLNF